MGQFAHVDIPEALPNSRAACQAPVDADDFPYILRFFTPLWPAIILTSDSPDTVGTPVPRRSKASPWNPTTLATGALCGQFDSHLRQMERRFGLAISARGNQFLLAGGPTTWRRRRA